MSNSSEEQRNITRMGNPAKPQGEEGAIMLTRMNESHFAVTGWALGFWQLGENDTVLDIGCGGGATLKRMSAPIVSGKLFGADYSEVSVGLSIKNNAADVESGKMKIIKASVETLPFADETFDKIITVESFYFWPDPKENLKEVCRVLKRGGTFLLVADIYNKPGLSRESLENIKQYNMFNPTESELYDLLSAAGFSDIVLHTKDAEDWICAEAKK